MTDDHQHAVEACQHAVDALETGDLPHARSLLDEARAAVNHAQSGETLTQEHREVAYDCYE